MTSEGFVKASSNNLPSVDIFMVMEFIKNDDRFNAAKFRNVEATAATRESYGDNAIGYVELKREGSLCTLQCKICPEHRVRSKNYSVSLIIDETEEKIVNVMCKDCAASSGGCKHALAFLMWVHRRSEDPSPTDITSYWVKPRLSAVGTSLKFVTAADFGSKKIAHYSSTAVTGATFKEEIVSVGLREKLEGPILQYGSNEEADSFSKLSMYKLLLRFNAERGQDCDSFLLFSMGGMCLELCEEAEKLTRRQSDSPLWHDFRFGRVTASKLQEFAHCKVADGTLVETIIGAHKVKDTKHMKRGRLLEKDVIKTVEKQLNMKFTDCGLFMLPKYPVFGASPDAISSEFVVEVKCPSSEKTLTSYIKDGQIGAKFKAQLHLQMLCTKRKRGIFCVAQPDHEHSCNIEILFVEYDEMYLNVLLEKAVKNWKDFIFPKLYKSVSLK